MSAARNRTTDNVLANSKAILDIVSSAPVPILGPVLSAATKVLAEVEVSRRFIIYHAHPDELTLPFADCQGAQGIMHYSRDEGNKRCLFNLCFGHESSPLIHNI